MNPTIDPNELSCGTVRPHGELQEYSLKHDKGDTKWIIGLRILILI